MNKKYFLSILLMLDGFLSVNSNGQMPQAVIQDHLILDETKSDEFSGSVLDTSKWWYVDACNDTDSIKHGFNWGGSVFFRPENVSVIGGNLMLKVEYNPDSLDTLTPCLHHHPYPFYSGGIISMLKNGGAGPDDIGNYSFGYYEMRAKLPGYINTNGDPIGFGFMPTFWIYYQHWNNGCVDKHDEVDILEPDPFQYYDARTNVVGWHDEDNFCNVNKIGQDSMRSIDPLFQNFHTYGMELTPEKIVFYFDDEIFFSADTISFPGIAHSLDMSPYLCVVMNIQMGGHNTPGPYSDAPFPEYMYVDYFRYYGMQQSFDQVNKLSQNSSNPVTGETEIECSIAANARNARLIFSLPSGEIIHSLSVNQVGTTKFHFKQSEFRPGIYFYSLNIGGEVVDTKKMIVIR